MLTYLVEQYKAMRDNISVEPHFREGYLTALEVVARDQGCYAAFAEKVKL